MKILINIPKEIYDYIRNECMTVRCCDTHKVAEAIFYGRVLNKTEEREIDEIINPRYVHINGYAYRNGCCSCPHSGSIIDGYRDCPDAYTEQAQHCGFYNKGE